MRKIDLPKKRIQRIDIDDEDCIRCWGCCPGGCVKAPSIFVEPDEGVPALHYPREDWHEEEVLDAVYGCPSGAISVSYETYRLTTNGRVPFVREGTGEKPVSNYVLETDCRQLATDWNAGSAQNEYFYEPTIRVIDNSTDRVIREFEGFHSRSPISREIYQSEGVQSAEFAPDRDEVIVFEAGQRSVCILLRSDHPQNIRESRHGLVTSTDRSDISFLLRLDINP